MTIIHRFALVCSLAACGGGSNSTASTAPASGTAPTPAAAGTYEVPALAGDVTCFHGKGNVEFATGMEMGELEMYLRRGFDGSAVTEDALAVVGGNASRNWTTLAVTGAALTVNGKYKGGTFAGTGTAEGTAPNWSSWTVDTKLDAGASVHSEYRDAGGSIEATSMVSDGKGNQMMRFTVMLAPLDAAACTDVYSRHEPL
jgi:hypothetical protein